MMSIPLVLAESQWQQDSSGSCGHIKYCDIPCNFRATGNCPSKLQAAVYRSHQKLLSNITLATLKQNVYRTSKAQHKPCRY